MNVVDCLRKSPQRFLPIGGTHDPNGLQVSVETDCVVDGVPLMYSVFGFNTTTNPCRDLALRGTSSRHLQFCSIPVVFGDDSVFPNGVSDESLLAILVDRIACRAVVDQDSELRTALNRLQDAQECLDYRNRLAARKFASASK